MRVRGGEGSSKVGSQNSPDRDSPDTCKSQVMEDAKVGQAAASASTNNGQN